MRAFENGFGSYTYGGETIEGEAAGFKLIARVENDAHHRAPWAEEDGHGPVSDWTSRAKAPGERVLNRDGTSYRYYDFAEAVAIAKRDGWGWLPARLRTEQDEAGLWRAWCEGGPVEAGHPDINAAIRAVYAAHRATMTAKQYAEAAAERDFQVLKDWCEDEWFYCGIVVEAHAEGVELGSASLWGIECNYPDSDNEYLLDVANDLAREAISEARAKLAKLAEAAA